MLLLTGPPGSGKTSFCVAQLRECLRGRETKCLLLVPTSTLAEHLRNELSREGFVYSPRTITTFGRFIAEIAPAVAPVTPARLQLLVDRKLRELPLARYAGVREFAGFRSAVVRAIEEFSGAGGDATHLAVTDTDFAQVYDAVDDEIRKKGLRLRKARMEAVAARIRENGAPDRIWVCGFFGFTPPEVHVLQALSGVSRLTVSIPDGAPSAPILRAFAQQEQRFQAAGDSASRTLTIAPTAVAEANEIARRIQGEVASGRRFRDIGVLVRSEQPMVPALVAAFERFAIPARFYFAPQLTSDPTVRYLLALVDAALGGWDHATSLRALRMRGSPLERTGDGFEHRVLNGLPGRGLAALRELAPQASHGFFEELAQVDAWRASDAAPAVWMRRFEWLTSLFRPGRVEDVATAATGIRWRTQAMALEHFRDMVDETGAAFDVSATISFCEFVRALRVVLGTAPLRLIDHRRDVVHVIDAVEARQWRLPVLFMCGLLEGQFPTYHSEDPILPDDVRRRLQAAGVPVKTSMDRQAEEAHLFDLALSSATEQLHLSYAQLNTKGEPNLPSFYIERARPFTEAVAVPVRPRALRERGPEPHATVYEQALRTLLVDRHPSLSPSAIEAYLQCPYQFFGSRTLRLAEPPCDPYKRLNALVQGTIAHRVFELHFRDGISVAEAFDEAFREACLRERVPDSYRTEAVRLELLHGVEQLVSDTRIRDAGEQSLFESEFRVALADGTAVHGRIDRIEVNAGGHAVVFDYKYRSPQRLRTSVGEHEEGQRVQGGLYLIGARSMGFTPAGMVYCGFRREVSVAGWVLPPLYPRLKSTCSPDHLEDLMRTAAEVSMNAAAGIRDGKIAPDPQDEAKCDFCSLSAMCRIEVAKSRRAGGAGAAQ